MEKKKEEERKKKKKADEEEKGRMFRTKLVKFLYSAPSSGRITSKSVSVVGSKTGIIFAVNDRLIGLCMEPLFVLPFSNPAVPLEVSQW